MNDYRNELIENLCKLNVHADITVEELADNIIEYIKNINGRKYVEMFGTCPMCMDCPHRCPLDK